MMRKIFITITIALLIFTVGCESKNKKETNTSISENSKDTVSYQENFNGATRVWDITFETLDNKIEREFPINKGEILTIKGEINSGSSYLNVTQDGVDKDILGVPLDGTEVTYLLDRWDTNKKLTLEISPQNAKKGKIEVRFKSQQ